MYRFVILFILIVFVGKKTYSQDKQLFAYLADQRSQLGENSLQKLESWELKSFNLATDFINVMDIATEHSDIVKFTLPDVTDTLYATVSSIIQRKDLSLVWSGIIGCYEGNIMLITTEKGVYGYIAYQNTNYSVRTLGEGFTALISQKLSGSGDCATEDGEIITTPLPPNKNCCKSTILVLYTPQAAIDGNPNEVADIGVEDINQALMNSGICHEVERVGMQLFEFVEGTNITLDRIKLKNDTFVQSLRDQEGADVVILLTGDAYSDFGLAFIPGTEGNPDQGFAIVEVTAPEMRHTFAHEWGHLFNAVHEHGYAFGNDYRTIMGSTPLDGGRILHYTNPDVLYDGFPTGLEGEKDNAERIDALGCVVADYRQTGEPCETFMVSIDYELIDIDGEKFHQFCVAEDNPECYVRPDEIEWEYDYHGSYSQDGGIEECVLIPRQGFLFPNVRLTINCGNCTSTAYYTNYIVACNNLKDRGSPDAAPSAPHALDVVLAPNPCSGFVTVTFGGELLDHGVADYRITNVQGQVLGSGKLSESITSGRLELDVHALESGIYYLFISSSKNNYHEKFVVQN